MAELSEKKRWYVLRAISGKESKVKEYIELDIKNRKLGDYVSQVLIPTEKVVSVHNNKRTVTERNLLSGYVLVEAVLIGEVPHILRNTPNVLGYLESNGKPAPLRQYEVNRLLGIGDETEVLNEVVPELDFVIGESVKVADGPFSGFNGSVEEINSEKKKLKVSVKIFGRVTPLELSFTQVEKL